MLRQRQADAVHEAILLSRLYYVIPKFGVFYYRQGLLDMSKQWTSE